jgi:hypothetical protein
MKVNITREALHQKIYLLALAILVCSLPLSKYLMSVAQLLLALNWIAEGRFRKKVTMVKNKPAVLLFASVFLIYVTGLFYTQNIHLGMEKVRNALPLLLFPLIMGTAVPLSNKNVKWLLLLFSGAVMAAALACMVNFLLNGLKTNGNFRDISVFMLHIRFSLLIVMAIFILLYLTFYDSFKSSYRARAIYLISAFLLIAFLFFLRSFTGIVIFVVLITVFVLNMTFRNKCASVRYLLLILVAGFLFTIIAFTLYTYVHNFHAKPIGISSLARVTANGNPYSHDIQAGILENGNYVDLYVCEPELEKEWNKVSNVPFDSFDNKGQQINLTIKRYMTSKGLRKDAAAMRSLSATDIIAIEKGLTNYKFRVNPGLYQRFYESLWEIHVLLKTGYVQKHSLGQRFAFLSVASDLIPQHKWIGVGTGDVYDSMLQVPQRDNSSVDPLWEGKPHNQFVFFILAFGFIGFFWIVFCWVYPIVTTPVCGQLLFNIFAGIVLISMLILDTLESYDSIVFFAFFYCLFVLSQQSQHTT